jgi:4-alpha-glucanotransferase
MKRGCGILLPISSLPGNYGIGGFSKEAYRFVDKLRAAAQCYWQILPLGPTGTGDSPYQSFTAFGGNVNYISLEKLIEDEVLAWYDINWIDWGSDPYRVDYQKVGEHRERILRLAYKNFCACQNRERVERYLQAVENLSEETKKYCEYQAIKKDQEGKPWYEWEEKLRNRDKEAMEEARSRLKEDLDFYLWEQAVFDMQWMALKNYANQNGVEIIGDMPIYVAYDSADVWMHQEMFQLHKDGTPKAVAGCPPDYFAPQGQLWGNPLYDWKRHKKDGYSWWIERMRYALRIFDCVRVDHFRGFDEYYSIPAGDDHAMNGTWEKGPGVELFDILKKHFAHQFEGGELPIIAEDLGLLTDSVTQLLEEVGFPGMKVLEFAFSSDCDNDYLPHNYPRNCVAYTGTHDNTTLRGWIDSLSEELRYYVVRYEGSEHTPHSDLHWDCIRTVLSSVADTVIIPMQDYLGLGNEARMNTPGTGEGNWQWRMREESFNDGLIWHCDLLSSIYGRRHKLKSEQK